jgi:hypothetical protein
MTGSTPAPSPTLPASLLRYVRPWWKQRVVRLGAALEEALESSMAQVEIDDRTYTVEQVAEMLSGAMDMADHLAAMD